MIIKFELFTEGILDKLTKDYFTDGIKQIDNFKPSVEFDNKYGTNISQEYRFPFGLTSDEIWNIIYYNFDYIVKYKENSPKIIKILNNLTIEHFPYEKLFELDINKKLGILTGMSSCFNYDDIIWFMIYGIDYSRNNKINNKINKLPKHIRNDIQWVVSPNTFIKIKNYFNI